MEEFTLRPLVADDLFPMFGIISKIGISELKECFNADVVKSAVQSYKTADGEENPTNIEEIGVKVAFEVADVLFRNLPRCKDEIYTFLSGLSGMTKAEIGKLKPSTLLRMIKEVVKKEEFVDFFQEALLLFR